LSLAALIAASHPFPGVGFVIDTSHSPRLNFVNTNVKKRKKRYDFKDAYHAAAEELASILRQKDALDLRITALRKSMTSLASLISQDDESFLKTSGEQMMQMLDLSTTDDIFNIVSAAKEPLTSSDVLEELRRLGCTAIQHDNPLATVNAILNRLSERKKLEVTQKGDRKAWFKKQYSYERGG
jgi:hypothetical protein